MRWIIVVLIAIASPAAACVQTGAGTVGEAHRCSQPVECGALGGV